MTGVEAMWTYDNTWYWGSASGRVGNDLFGFNIGCGSATSAATENMLFFNGIAHKLSEVYFNIQRRERKRRLYGKVDIYKRRRAV